MSSIYLDNAATTALDARVLEAMLPYYKTNYGNPSSIHEAGRNSRLAIEEARKEVAHLLSCKPAEMFFTSCGTESTNTVLQAAVRKLNCKTIITSPIEHHATLHTAEILSKEFGVELIFCQHDANGEINYNHLVGAIKESTPKGKTLVSIMHANNEIGVINDIQRIGLLCQENGALFHSDMVQTIGHLDVSLSNFNIDFASLSAHKFHGPKGNGALYIKSEVSIDPIIIGGGQERNMRAGTEDVAGIVGLAKALSLAIEDQEKEDKHCNALKLLCFDLLKESINEVSRSTNNKESLSRVLNVVFPVNPKTEMLQMALDIKGFAVSGGSACSSGALGGSHVIQHLHSSPCVPLRISFSKWNTKGEVEKLVKTIKELLN